MVKKVCINQGDILSVEGIKMPVLAVSKNFFNRTEQIIACPIVQKSMADPLHINVSAENVNGLVLCEQMKLLDMRARGYKKISELKLEEVINITDAIQGIFDYL